MGCYTPIPTFHELRVKSKISALRAAKQKGLVDLIGILEAHKDHYLSHLHLE